jgi:diacylglycerol O-acyltransferase / wax synthase
MTERSIGVRYDVFPLPLGELRAAAKAVEGKLNTALLAGVSAGLAEYHRGHGSDDDEFTVAMPVNLRGSDAPTLGNHFSIARFRAPLRAESMTERLTAARDLSAAQRGASGLGLTGALTRVLNTLPAPVAVPVFGSVLGASDVVVSNIPGSPIPLYVAGASSVANYGFAPRAGAAVSITAISHIDEIHLAVNSDPAAIPDPEFFVDCLQTGFEAVREYA